MFIKNKFDQIDQTIELIYRTLSQTFGYTARITRIWELLPISFGLNKFEILDFQDYKYLELESYLIDQYKLWEFGNDINFSEIGEKILEVGDFTMTEKLLFSNRTTLEERLWAIFLVILDPNLIN